MWSLYNSEILGQAPVLFILHVGHINIWACIFQALSDPVIMPIIQFKYKLNIKTIILDRKMLEKESND